VASPKAAQRSEHLIGNPAWIRRFSRNTMTA
jgi:hypothetical protein